MKTATTTIASWGNSEAIRIPRGMLQLAGFSKGDPVIIELNSRGNLEIRLVKDGHRHVEPTPGVTFAKLFEGYEGGRENTSDPLPDDEPMGAERDAWSA